MIEEALKDLEAEIALMRDAGRTHLPMRFEMIEALIALARAVTGKTRRKEKLHETR